MTREWQPIETAPVMRSVLLFAVTERDGDTITNWKMGSGHKDHAGDWEWCGFRIRLWDHQPTHWMPLPEPPVS